MVDCSGIKLKKEEYTNCYLEGTITGLSTEKEYALFYWSAGISRWVDVNTSNYKYTYITGTTSVNLGASGCWVPAFAKNGSIIQLQLYEVSGRTDNWIGLKCNKNVNIEATVVVKVLLKDQNEHPVMNAQINIPTAVGAKTIATNINGYALGFTLIQSTGAVYYDAKVSYLPNGYALTSGSTKHFYADQPGKITLTCKKEADVRRCNEGEKSDKEICKDGTVIYHNVCKDNNWRPSGETCPEQPTRPVGEKAKLELIDYTVSARQYDDVSANCRITNIGDEKCELVLRLCEQTGRVLDNNPDAVALIPGFFSLNKGESIVKNVSTRTHLDCMPKSDWLLAVKLDELNGVTRATTQTYQTINFTVKYTGSTTQDIVDYFLDAGGNVIDAGGNVIDATVDAVGNVIDATGKIIGKIVDAVDDIIDDGPRLVDCPVGDPTQFKMTADSFTVSQDVEIIGSGAPPNTEIAIMGEKKWFGFDYLARDTTLLNLTSDSNGDFGGTLELDEIGIVSIYAKVKHERIKAHPAVIAVLGFIPLLGMGVVAANAWLARDWKTKKSTVYVLNYTIVVVCLLLFAVLMDKLTGSRMINKIKGAFSR